MPRLPAICNNPNCGIVFPSRILVSNNSSVSFIDCYIEGGRCPLCRSMGIVPNGEYSMLTEKLVARLFSVRDAQYLKRVQRSIEKVLSKNTANPRSRLKVKEPSWREIWNLLPKNKNEAITLLQLILAFIGTAVAVNSCSSKPPEQNIFIENSYDRYYQTYGQPNNRIESKKNQIESQKTSII